MFGLGVSSPLNRRPTRTLLGRAPLSLSLSLSLSSRVPLSFPEQRAIAQKQGIPYTPDAALSATARPVAWIKTKVTVAPNITVRGVLYMNLYRITETVGNGVEGFSLMENDCFAAKRVFVSAVFVGWLHGSAYTCEAIFTVKSFVIFEPFLSPQLGFVVLATPWYRRLHPNMKCPPPLGGCTLGRGVVVRLQRQN